MEENARAEQTPSTVLVSHLADGDVVDSCFDITQGTWQSL
jgi:hypothetical protein